MSRHSVAGTAWCTSSACRAACASAPSTPPPSATAPTTTSTASPATLTTSASSAGRTSMHQPASLFSKTFWLATRNFRKSFLVGSQILLKSLKFPRVTHEIRQKKKFLQGYFSSSVRSWDKNLLPYLRPTHKYGTQEVCGHRREQDHGWGGRRVKVPQVKSSMLISWLLKVKF